jgi:hypothetical protein
MVVAVNGESAGLDGTLSCPRDKGVRTVRYDGDGTFYGYIFDLGVDLDKS